MPRTNRPPESWPTVAAWTASASGLHIRAAGTTEIPVRTGESCDHAAHSWKASGTPPAGGVPDAFHVCAAWSQDSPVRTGISVVPAARMWSPLALAVQAATVGEISGGRFVLGMGTGGYGPGFWASVRLPNRPIAVMRDYLTVVRGLLAGETIAHDGPALHVQGASL